MGNKLFKSKSKKFEYNKESGASSSGAGGTSSQPTSGSTTDSPRHKGSILGTSCIDDRLISCSDDNTLIVSSAGTKGTGPFTQLIGHKRAVNRVVGFKHPSNGTSMCWSASRDLSIRCVRHLCLFHLVPCIMIHLLPRSCANFFATTMSTPSLHCSSGI